MGNPEAIQVNENKENELLNQEQQNTINDINKLLANNNKEISKINDLLNKEFLKGISADLAGEILKSIPDSLHNNSDIQKVITVLSAKTSVSGISGNNNNLEDYSNDTGMDLGVGGHIDVGNFIIDLSTYKKDISGNSDLYGLTGLTGELQQCLSLIGSSENLQNLKNNLEGIKNIIDGKSTKLNDLNKIEQFLINNQIELRTWNENNIAPLLQGIHTFILKIAPTLSHNKSNQEKATKILDEEEQRINAEKAAADLEREQRNIKLIEMSTSFSELESKIPNDLKNLSKLNKKDINNIKDFITESKSNNSISTHTNARESVFALYLKMNLCQQAINSNTSITHRDRNNFNEIFNHITETFNNNEIQNYELGLRLKGIDETNLKLAAPQNWNGKFLTMGHDGSFLETTCKCHVFKPKDYIDKFNSINESRVNNIISQLKNYNISDFLQYFELNDSKDGLVPKNNIDHFNTLNDTEKNATLQGILTKRVASTVTNLVNGEDEIKRIIGEYHGGENSNILTDWTAKIVEELKKQQATPEGGDGHQETEITFEKLPDLNADSIKKVFSNLDKQDIVKFFNKQKARTDLTEPQKTQLVLLYEGLTKRFVNEEDNINRGKVNITTLQQHLQKNNTNLAIDGKFGKYTFRALKAAFGDETQDKGSIIKDAGDINVGDKTKGKDRKKDVHEKTQEETQQEILDNLPGIRESTLNEAEKTQFGIDSNITKTYKRRGYNGVYYFNNDNILTYIPNINKTTAGSVYNPNTDTKPFIRETRDGLTRTQEYPNNCYIFQTFFCEKLRENLPNKETTIQNTKIGYDTNKSEFFVLNNGYRTYIKKGMLEGNGRAKENLGKQLGLLALCNFLTKKLIDNKPSNRISDNIVISKNNETNSKYSGFEANRFNGNTQTGNWNIESKYIKRGYLEGIDTKKYFEHVVNLPKQKLT